MDAMDAMKGSIGGLAKGMGKGKGEREGEFAFLLHAYLKGRNASVGGIGEGHPVGTIDQIVRFPGYGRAQSFLYPEAEVDAGLGKGKGEGKGMGEGDIGGDVTARGHSKEA